MTDVSKMDLNAIKAELAAPFSRKLKAELESGSVLITHGTKGGRGRDVVSFDLERQKAVLELACLLVDPARCIAHSEGKEPRTVPDQIP